MCCQLDRPVIAPGCLLRNHAMPGVGGERKHHDLCIRNHYGVQFLGDALMKTGNRHWRVCISGHREQWNHRDEQAAFSVNSIAVELVAYASQTLRLGNEVNCANVRRQVMQSHCFCQLSTGF